MEIWLHVGLRGGEPGFHAWGLRHIGFATWAASEKAVLDLIPVKFDQYRTWLTSHGLAPRPESHREVEVVEKVKGHEILFGLDRTEATTDEINRTIELLAASRSDLLTTLDRLPDEALSWDPPYEWFAEWADWRTIRATLAHLANSEIHYYMTMIGHESARRPVEPHDSWRDYLPSTRAETVRFLEVLRANTDRRRISAIERRSRRMPRGALEEWSVRKALRRTVRHELLHTKSIRRIVHEWQQ